MRINHDWLVECATFMAIVSAFVVALAWCGGCRPASHPEPPMRAQARAAVLTMADGVRAADGACAAVARARRDLELADRCGRAYQVGRSALLAAEAALDTAGEHRAACAAAPAAVALGESVAAMRAAGSTVPPAVVDAVAMAGALARLVPCEEQ